ncbi:MAG TPA: HD domain-containing protein [candidate division Zixibacteria bacterium]|nr:HD domain-containing protein [candidate division Zixibacteria bacterium]
MSHPADTEYEGTALIADPIHRYIQFTVPRRKGEVTEKAIVDSPWVQRLRYIYQLQSARWVYPSAEHSRFQHSLGAMHLAGEFAKHLYPSLRAVLGDECPSAPLVEEYMRITGLLHDVGHGPFGHFFDDNFLHDYGLTHEDLGQAIIQKHLGDLICQLRRSPNGPFAPGEELKPEYVAFPIKKDGEDDPQMPRWVRFLQPLTSGIFTFDNLDYVSRDSYMCGVAAGPVDCARLLYYTFFSPKGLTLHKAGNSALTMFLNTRLYLYTNVYYHRTTRAIDLHLRDIFPETMRIVFPGNPLQHMEDYLYLTDWSLLEEVSRWRRQKGEREALGREWDTVLRREVKWKMAYDRTLSLNELQYGVTLLQDADWEKRIRAALPQESRGLVFRVDMATQDPRPENPFAMGKKQIHIFDPSTGEITKESLAELFEFIPSKVVQFRVFALDHDHDQLLSEVAERALKNRAPAVKTSV